MGDQERALNPSFPQHLRRVDRVFGRRARLRFQEIRRNGVIAREGLGHEDRQWRMSPCAEAAADKNGQGRSAREGGTVPHAFQRKRIKGFTAELGCSYATPGSQNDDRRCRALCC